MKKVILIAFAFSLLSTTAFAATTTFSSAGANPAVTGVLAGFKASKEVNVVCSSADQTYAAVADHLNGTRVYGLASGDPLIYFNEVDKTAGTHATPTTVLTHSDSSSFVGVTNWSSL